MLSSDYEPRRPSDGDDCPSAEPATCPCGRYCGLEYQGAQRREMTRRDVEPLGLVYYSDNWHLIAYCRLWGNVRDFRTDRICKRSHSPDLPEVFAARPAAIGLNHFETWRPYRYSILHSSHPGGADTGQLWETLGYLAIWFSALLGIGICFG